MGFTINPKDTRARHRISCFPIQRIEDVSTSKLEQSLSSEQSAVSEANKISSGGVRHFLKSIPGLRAVVLILRRMIHAVVAAAHEPKFLLESYRCLKGVDLLLLAGSQQLNDLYGTWTFPYTLFKWVVLARWTGTKVALLSVGAGPINGLLSRFFIKRVLHMVAYRSYRDSISSDLVRSLGVKGDHPVFPDLVYSLQLPVPKTFHKTEQRVIVGANPVPFYDTRYWATADSSRYEDYVRKLARFSEWLDQTGHSILFFPTQARADVYTIEDILRSMNGSSNSPNILDRHPIQTLEDLVSEIARTDIVIANRYHGILISLMMNKPVLGIAYHEKSRVLLAQAGLGDYVLSASDFRIEDLIDKFRSLEANAPALRREISAHLAPLRKALDDQYDSVLGLIGTKIRSSWMPG
jgi:polysaccharide pyruvyl transferase WcaK-like protein